MQRLRLDWTDLLDFLRPSRNFLLDVESIIEFNEIVNIERVASTVVADSNFGFLRSRIISDVDVWKYNIVIWFVRAPSPLFSSFCSLTC